MNRFLEAYLAAARAIRSYRLETDKTEKRLLLSQLRKARIALGAAAKAIHHN